MRATAFAPRTLVFALLLLAACQPAAPSGGAAPAKPAAGAAGSAPAAANAPAAAPAAKPGGGDVTIGVTLELSGPASVFGQPHQDVMRLIVARVNGQGGVNGQQVKLVVYDNESSETKSLVTVKRLAEEDNALVILGAAQTPTTMSFVTYANNEAQVPIISMGSSNAIVEPPAERHWIFKTPANTRQVATQVVR